MICPRCQTGVREEAGYVRAHVAPGTLSWCKGSGEPTDDYLEVLGRRTDRTRQDKRSSQGKANLRGRKLLKKRQQAYGVYG